MSADRSNPEPTSTSLLARARRQDGDAWLKLFTWIGPLILRWCNKAGLQPADSEDVAQETLRSIWRNLDTFRKDQQGHSFRGWVYVITRSHITNVRRLGANRSLPSVELPAAPENTEAVDLKRRALALMLHEVLARHASDTGFKAFYRTAVDGLPAPEAALELGLKSWTVRQHKSRWAKRLRDRLQEEYGELLG